MSFLAFEADVDSALTTIGKTNRWTMKSSGIKNDNVGTIVAGIIPRNKGSILTTNETGANFELLEGSSFEGVSTPACRAMI